MKVFIIYKEDFPWDVRVEKIALSLVKANAEVTIICRNLEQQESETEKDGYHIKRLPKLTYLPKSLRFLFNLPLWFNPIWLHQIYKYTKGNSGALLIVRDLPLVKSALIIGKVFKMPVIYDMAEVYPEMYASSGQFSKRNISERLLKNPKLASKYEKSVLPHINRTLVMIEESRDRLLKKGIPESRITIVSNTPPIEKFSGKVKPHQGRVLNLVYVGFLTKIRGLDLLIEAANEFLTQSNDRDCLFIDIVGKGSMFNELQEMIHTYGLQQNVRLHGWLEQKEVDNLFSRANVGFLTYRVCGHWNHTIPNKIFDYMLFGLPVLATPITPIKRIVETTKCGLISSDATPASIAASLRTLQNPELREIYGRNGNRAVLEYYNWSKDEARLLKICQELSSPPS